MQLTFFETPLASRPQPTSELFSLEPMKKSLWFVWGAMDLNKSLQKVATLKSVKIKMFKQVLSQKPALYCQKVKEKDDQFKRKTERTRNETRKRPRYPRRPLNFALLSTLELNHEVLEVKIGEIELIPLILPNIVVSQSQSTFPICMDKTWRAWAPLK